MSEDDIVEAVAWSVHGACVDVAMASGGKASAAEFSAAVCSAVRATLPALLKDNKDGIA